MRLTRQLKWTAALVLLGLGAAAVVGCQAEAQIGGNIETPPPPPPPPPPDQDGDGILDPDDKCPTEKEDQKPPDPNDGCPNLDEDGDGIPVPQDKCPGEPETVNDFEDDDGCPDEKPLAQVTEKEVKINQKIMFGKGDATITPDSMKVVEAVGAVLKDHKDIELIEIGGHASKEGNEYYNRNLTQRRTKSVQDKLIELGVEKQRLTPVGYGYYCLLDPGDTEAANEKNRRVEFRILFRKGKALDTKRGCQAAEEKGIKPTTPAKSPWNVSKEGAAKGAPATAAPAAGKAAQKKGAAPAAAK